MNKIIEVIKNAIAHEKNEVADFVLFEEGEKVASQPEETLSKFKICSLEIMSILDRDEFPKDELKLKITELEEIHNKRIKSLKEVLKEQSVFYRKQRNELKEKLKNKGIKITTLENEVRSLNELTKIYKKLEKKYFEALNEIERLNKFNESQRIVILKRKA